MKRERVTFTSEMDEELIKVVKSHEELYNIGHRRYSDTSHKAYLWTEVGSKIQQHAETCKRRWESLRSQYRKNRRLQRIKSGQNAKSIKKWKYDDELAFLNPFMVNHNEYISLDTESTSSQDNEDNDDNEDNEDNEDSLPNEKAIEAIFFEDQTTMVDQQKFLKSTPASSAVGSPVASFSKNCLEDDSPKVVQKDDLDLFFESIKATVRKFSAADVHLAKQKIFNIVSEIESTYVGLPRSKF